MILALILALAIGFSLALLGSGGSIITLPVLVYAARLPAPQAVGMSLARFSASRACSKRTDWMKASSPSSSRTHGKAVVSGRPFSDC